MRRGALVLALAALAIGQIAGAGERGGVGIAPKIWFADPWKIQFLTMNEQGPESTMAGLQLTYDLNDNYWLSGLWMQGEFDDTFRDTRTTEDQSVRLETTAKLEETDAEIILGRTFKHADLGVGLRYSEFVREFSAEGPYLREQYGVTYAEGSADNSVLGPMLEYV